VRHGDRLRHWMTEQLASCPSPRMLANLAFRFGRYRIAYELGELEDTANMDLAVMMPPLSQVVDPPWEEFSLPRRY
jgi:hypothetical protein